MPRWPLWALDPPALRMTVGDATVSFFSCVIFFTRVFVSLFALVSILILCLLKMEILVL